MSIRPYASLYLHVPFCRSKCDYCAFYSVPNNETTTALPQLYLKRLEEEFRQYQQYCQKLRSIYIGGGTPSALNHQQLFSLLELINRYFQLEENCEWTMEANPESLDPKKLALAVSAGVNRLSMGIQSFVPALRQTLGRKGTLDNLPEIQRTCQQLGLKNLNLDLIFAIPGQTVEDFQHDLRRACETYQPAHLSTYALIIEPDTPINARLKGTVIDDELFLDFWHCADAVCQEFGLARYEIANFAQESRQCRHNFEIWHGQTYLGCGPSAVSFNGSNRYANSEQLHDWLAGKGSTADILPAEQRAAEILAFGLRTTAGWDCQEFHSLTGYDLRQLRGEAIAKLCRQKLLADTGQNIHPTHKGLLFNDDILIGLL